MRQSQTGQACESVEVVKEESSGGGAASVIQRRIRGAGFEVEGCASAD